jgi:hypothetical protein
MIRGMLGVAMNKINPFKGDTYSNLQTYSTLFTLYSVDDN